MCQIADPVVNWQQMLNLLFAYACGYVMVKQVFA